MIKNKIITLNLMALRFQFQEELELYSEDEDILGYLKENLKALREIEDEVEKLEANQC